MKAAHTSQQGVVLLEALIAILIFSLGILAIVGLQATSVKLSSDAKFRSDANLLIDQIIGQMWVSDRTSATLQTNFQGSGGTGGGAYASWVAAVANTLPGVSGVPANQPAITVVTSNLTTTPSSQVTITVKWQLPGDPATNPVHTAVVYAQII